MKIKILITLILLINSCKPDIRKDWIYDSECWTVDGDAIYYLESAADTSAWIEEELEDELTIEFTWEIFPYNNNDFELVVIIFGNKELEDDFWSDGIVISYLTRDNSNFSWIRIRGIYGATNAMFISTTENLSYFNPYEEHRCKIIYEESLLSFYIDDEVIQNNVLVDLEDKTGYFGIANYWENTDGFSISNVRIF